MRKIATSLLVAGVCLAFASTAFASTALRISQVYGGNGTAAGTLNQDFAELFNSSGSAISLVGYSLQYGSATTTTGFGTTTVLALTGTIPACGYYLVGLTSNTGGTALPVTPDQTSGVINISGTVGKLLLIHAAPAAVACLGNVNVEPATWMDEVGFGTGPGLCFEAAAAPAMTTTTCLVRASGGMTDTDNNSADFTTTTVATATLHNSTMTNGACLLTPTTSKTWGNLKMLYR